MKAKFQCRQTENKSARGGKKNKKQEERTQIMFEMVNEPKNGLGNDTHNH